MTLNETHLPVQEQPDNAETPARLGKQQLAWEAGKLVLFPVLLFVAAVASLAMVGVAQRQGWITTDGAGSIGSSTVGHAISYICPMMCVPPTDQPGRCPVCGMELVPAAGSSAGASDHIVIDPRSRRIAGIETVEARLERLEKVVEGVGEIEYDESRLKTLAAYFDGRIEKLYADYTGVQVAEGDRLAEIFAPDVYSAQVEYVRTLGFIKKQESRQAADSNQRLLQSSKQRLLELGMTEQQIEELETSGEAKRRIELFAPISGTVIRKLATTGDFVRAGDPVYQLADLSKVWLVLRVYPEDARLMSEGLSVTATADSMNALSARGQVEFVEPTVDPATRTVGVRVALDNQAGNLKPGEFARARIRVPIFSDSGTEQETVVVPRNSLLTVGDVALLYVEQEPGEFYLRRVRKGPTVNGWVAIHEGVKAGENVVARSAFLIDAQMQLQGNPSLIDPEKATAVPEVHSQDQLEIEAALAGLPEADRSLAVAQVICPVQEIPLGSMGMGTPIKVDVAGQPVFICCEGCRKSLLREPDRYQQILVDYHSNPGSGSQASARDSLETVPGMELPEMGLPEMGLPEMELPEMELPEMELPEAAKGSDGGGREEPSLPEMALPEMQPPDEG